MLLDHVAYGRGGNRFAVHESPKVHESLLVYLANSRFTNAELLANFLQAQVFEVIQAQNFLLPGLELPDIRFQHSNVLAPAARLKRAFVRAGKLIDFIYDIFLTISTRRIALPARLQSLQNLLIFSESQAYGFGNLLTRRLVPGGGSQAQLCFFGLTRLVAIMA